MFPCRGRPNSKTCADASGVAWYRRQFTVEPGLLDRPRDAAILHFGAVDYHATVWLNGELVGEHEGGYLPFEFDVIDLLREGDNECWSYVVVDPTDDRQTFTRFSVQRSAARQTEWYGPIGGIWQSVWLELRSATFRSCTSAAASAGRRSPATLRSAVRSC